MESKEIFRSEYDERISITPQEDSCYVVMTMEDQEGNYSEICVDKKQLVKSLKQAIKIIEE